MAIWNILWTFEIFYDHLVLCVFIWYSFPALEEKSGNPGWHFADVGTPSSDRWSLLATSIISIVQSADK
jgi:hypothetical protein